MKKRVLIGVSDFKRLVGEGNAYVDKTLFIEEVLEKGTKVALITRPPLFGKTLNLSMLRYFFEKGKEDTSYLFNDLNIWKNEKYRMMQGQFPVVFISFGNFYCNSWKEASASLSMIISIEFDRHRYLMDGNFLSPKEKENYLKIITRTASESLLTESLLQLTEWLYRYHKKRVIVLIDNYDTPAYVAYIGKYYSILIQFLFNWLSAGLKDNNCLEKGVLTGLVWIREEGIFSGFNNYKAFTMLDESFGDKFGFVESEVKALLKNYGLESKLPEIKQWYGGYCIGSCECIYNPFSILNYITPKGALVLYWTRAVNSSLMERFITKGSYDLKMDIENLFKGGSIERTIDTGIVFSELEKSSSNVLSLLVLGGYLTVDTKQSYGVPGRFRIPNIEVKKLYEAIIEHWLTKGIGESKYHELLRGLTKGDMETFSGIFQELLCSSAHIFDISTEELEDLYQTFVLWMLIGLKDSHEVKSNRESGLGGYDVMLIPEDTQKLGVILEFKKIGSSEKTDLETAAISALKQIEDKQYSQELLDRGIHRILCVGLAFKGKEVLIHHKLKA